MATHLWQSKSLHPANRDRIVNRYEYARQCGYTDVESQRFAMQESERHRQGSPTYALPPQLRTGQYGQREIYKDPVRCNGPFYCDSWLPIDAKATIKAMGGKRVVSKAIETYYPYWRNGLGVHASEYTFARLVLGKPLPGDDGLANLSIVMDRIGAHARPAVARAAILATANILTVLGDVSAAAAACTVGHTQRRYQQAWVDVTKGRDLFIPGLGSFDINAAVAIRKQTFIGKVGMVDVNVLRAIGYCLRFGIDTMSNYEQDTRQYLHHNVTDLEKVLLNETALAHFIRYRDYWLTPGNHLDLLQFTQPEHAELEPVALSRALRGVRRRVNRVGTYKPQPPKEYNYQWLSQWPDKQVGDLVVSPVKTSQELRAAADKLKNCASAYAGSIATGQMAILVARKGDKPKAMMLLRRGVKTYEQCYGPCNQDLPAPIDKSLRATAKTYAKLWSAK